MSIITRGMRTVIPSIQDVSGMNEALDTAAPAVLIVGASIFNIAAAVRRCHTAGKKVLVRPDLIAGLRSDRTGIRLLATEAKVDGVFTGSSTTARLCADAQLPVFWRQFLLDSVSVNKLCTAIPHHSWDGIELVPGPAVKKCAGLLTLDTEKIYFAGGLISTQQEVDELFESGIDAVITSTSSLWRRT